ncbi:MAG: lysophospholipid acyltransferase family protein [Bacteroidales bacterium]|nr:lysophospholipid acyltransferase family protein [Bacteroidales bacterium]
MAFFGAFLFFLAVIFVGLLPFPLMYVLSDLFVFLMLKVIAYRKSVVLSNLKGSFGNLSSADLRRLTKGIYRNLSDIIWEGVKAFTMSKRQVLKRHRILNPELLEPYFRSGRSLIGVTGHYGNWEWGTLSSCLYSDFKIVGFYKPLSNRFIDRIVRWSRARYGTTLASIEHTTPTFLEWKDGRTVFLMAADQGMPKQHAHKAYWIDFLNRDTPFLHGLEKHARMHNLPVFYIDVQRMKRGYYTLELSFLTTDPMSLPKGKLTELYARKLESVILKNPENWLWTHRRWRLSR